LREQGKEQEALACLECAARLNEKTSSNEVLRELGAAQLATGDLTGALVVLEKYVARREYDPAGLVYYGEALSAAGKADQAREMFERAIEAVRTMPGHRRGEVRGWAGRAGSGLKKIV
jgi:tetratricopeptide (TPR) repeat protein